MTEGRLAQPIDIAGHVAPSRVVFGPHETNLGDGRAFSDRHVAYYARRARGGTGVLVTETASVTEDDWPYERAPLASTAGAGWSAVGQACRPYGTVVLAGIGHAGSQGSSAFSQSVMWAPSRVADVVSREPPAQLDGPAIERLVAAFSAAAAQAVRSGLDGVEIDAGAWSLLRQFHSGLTNQRSDGYGADRLRFTTEVLEAVRRAVGPDAVVALRLSCDELAPWAGTTPEQAAGMVEVLAPHVDVLTVVRGGPFSTGAYRPDGHASANFNLGLCAQIHRAVARRALVALQGSVVDPLDAEAALESGDCDLVEMTRAQIADARLVSLWRAGHAERIRPCLLCNQACRVRDNRNPIVSCVIDPRSGHETVDPDLDELEDSRPGPGSTGAPVMVVGSGPAGLECARVLAAAGRQVRVIERAGRTGGTVVVAATGVGRDRLDRSTRWLESECRRLGVGLETGRTVTADDVRVAGQDGWEVVLATGSRPSTGSFTTTGAPAVIEAAEALESGSADWPDGPVVISDPVGGPVAISVAERLAAESNRAVTLVCPDPVAGTLLSLTGDLADANVRLQRAGVTRQLRSVIRRVGDGQLVVSDVWTGVESTIPAAVLVDCRHRSAEDSLYLEVGDVAVIRAGDCVAPRTILEAVLEGRRAAQQLLVTDGIPPAAPAASGAGGRA